MSVGGLPRCVALMVVLAWMLWPYAPRGRALLPVSSRVPRAGRKTGAGDAVRNGRVMGLSGVIAHMSSSVRAGGMISGVLACCMIPDAVLSRCRARRRRCWARCRWSP